MGNLNQEIDKAVEAATEQVTAQVIRDHLGPSALRQLQSIVKTRPEVGSLTLEKLLHGFRRSPKRSQPKGKRKFRDVDLRSDDLRGRFDAKVFMVVSKLQEARISQIHAEVGGEIHQVRGALNRLKKDERITSIGFGRGCKYLKKEPEPHQKKEEIESDDST